MINRVTHSCSLWSYSLWSKFSLYCCRLSKGVPSKSYVFFYNGNTYKNMKRNGKVSQTPFLGLCPALIYLASFPLWVSGAGREREACAVHKRSFISWSASGSWEGRDLGCSWCLQSSWYGREMPVYPQEAVNGLRQSLVFVVYQLFWYLGEVTTEDL